MIKCPYENPLKDSEMIKEFTHSHPNSINHFSPDDTRILNEMTSLSLCKNTLWDEIDTFGQLYDAFRNYKTLDFHNTIFFEYINYKLIKGISPWRCYENNIFCIDFFYCFNIL